MLHVRRAHFDFLVLASLVQERSRARVVAFAPTQPAASRTLRVFRGERSDPERRKACARKKSKLECANGNPFDSVSKNAEADSTVFFDTVSQNCALTGLPNRVIIRVTGNELEHVRQ